MKNIRIFVFGLSVVFFLTSCGLISNIFRPKYGCPSNGKNVGAEKILSGDPKATKSARKAKKFTS